LLVLPWIAGAQPSAEASKSPVAVVSTPYSEAALAAELAAGRTVFVNMTADWCITCKVTEQRLLHTERVETLFATQGVVRMVGDWTRYDAAITAYLNRFERVGVPLYVVETPNQPPRVLSQFPSWTELAEAIQPASR